MAGRAQEAADFVNGDWSRRGCRVDVIGQLTEAMKVAQIDAWRAGSGRAHFELKELTNERDATVGRRRSAIGSLTLGGQTGDGVNHWGTLLLLVRTSTGLG